MLNVLHIKIFGINAMVFISVSKMVLVDFATLTARAEGSFSQLH